MLGERTFHTGEVELNYAEGPPNGPPVILLSGLTGRWQAFLSVIPLLLPLWHVYALDYRGHGRSGRTPGHYRGIDYSTDCFAFLERRVAEPTVLLGSSMGGRIALDIAASLPDWVRAVIGLDPPGIDLEAYVEQSDAKTLANMWAVERRLAGRPLDEILPSVPLDRAQELSCLDPEVPKLHAEGRLHEFFADLPSKADLQRIACPVLLVQGNPALGAKLTDSDVQSARENLPRLTHVRLEDRGHDVGLEADAPWVPTMLEFLASI